MRRSCRDLASGPGSARGRLERDADAHRVLALASVPMSLNYLQLLAARVHHRLACAVAIALAPGGGALIFGWVPSAPFVVAGIAVGYLVVQSAVRGALTARRWLAREVSA